MLHLLDKLVNGNLKTRLSKRCDDKPVYMDIKTSFNRIELEIVVILGHKICQHTYRNHYHHNMNFHLDRV